VYLLKYYGRITTQISGGVSRRSLDLIIMRFLPLMEIFPDVQLSQR